MDADLQDEPEVLLEMYQILLTEKVDVVYAVRTSRRETELKRFFYFVFYRLYLFLADSPVQIDSGDFCVMSRRAVRLLLSLPEKLRFVRGLRAWIGLPSKPFPISRPARAAGSAVFVGETDEAGILRVYILFNKAIEGGTSCAAAFFASVRDRSALIYLGIALFTGIHVAAPGFSTLVIVLLFSNGLIFLYLGILGEYIGQMFLEVKERPSFIVERTINVEAAEKTDERD